MTSELNGVCQWLYAGMEMCEQHNVPVFVITPVQARAILAGLEWETEEGTRNKLLAKSLDDVELTVRAYNGLRNANIRTVGELVHKTQRELLKSRNLGRKTLNEIKGILHSMGLTLAGQ